MINFVVNVDWFYVSVIGYFVLFGVVLLVKVVVILFGLVEYWCDGYMVGRK